MLIMWWYLSILQTRFLVYWTEQGSYFSRSIIEISCYCFFKRDYAHTGEWDLLTIHFLVSRTVCSGEHGGWAAGLSGAVSSISGRGYDQSDSNARQQQTQELEVTRPAVPPLCERVKKRPAWQALPTRSSLSRSPNSDKVLMRQDVSMACPGTQRKATRATHSVYMDYSLCHWQRKSAASPLWKMKKTMDQRYLIDIWRTPDSCVNAGHVWLH